MQKVVILMTDGTSESHTKMRNGMKNIICSLIHIVSARNHILQLYRADYADDEYIQELIAWQDPENSSEVVYTEHEKVEMLRLPRKECRSYFHEPIPWRMLTSLRFNRWDLGTEPLLDTNHTPLRLCLRQTNYAPRPDARKRLDNLFFGASILGTGLTAIYIRDAGHHTGFPAFV